MQRFLDEWKPDFRTPVPLVVWLFLSFVLPIAGSFGVYGTHSLPVLFAFWTVLAGGCILAATAIRAFVRVVLRLRAPWHEMLVVSALVTLAFTPAIHLAVRNVFGREGSLIVDLARLAATCLAVSLGVGVLRVTLPMAGGVTLAETDQPGPPAAAAQTPAAQAPAAPLPRLLLRLPQDRRGALIRMAVRDHYVDVVTDRGQTSVLMRFRDALAEVEGIDGLQVHRSHWVASAGVEAAQKSGDRVHVLTRDGERVLVSRAYRADLVARGLLQPGACRGMGRGRARGPVRMASAPAAISPVSAGSWQASPPV